MTVLRSLQLLLMADLPATLEGIELSAREITQRLDDVDRDTPIYRRAHHRLDELLDARQAPIHRAAHLVDTPGGG